MVKDDGKGFNVEMLEATPPTERGLGLAAMNERARMLSGSLTISSLQGKGATIKLTVPIGEEARSGEVL